MKKRSRHCVWIVLLLGVMGICILVVVSAERRECALLSVLLNKDQLPGHWQMSDGGAPLPYYLLPQDRDGAREAYCTILENEVGDTLGHTVYRYRNRWLAAFHMWWDNRPIYYSSCTAWVKIEDMPDLPLHADQVVLLHGRDDCGAAPAERFMAFVRYGGYVSMLSTTTSEENPMPLAEFLDVLLEVDGQFQQCLR